MNFSTLTYKLLTGEWREDVARVRELRKLNEHKSLEQFYAGAHPGNQRPTPSQLSTPEDYRQAVERIVLIRAARQMEIDFPFFDGLLGDFETYVVGNLQYIPNTGNPEADAEISAFLEVQFDRTQCDWSQRLDLTKLARLSVRSMKRDGECGFELVQEDYLKINAISGDRIGNPTIGPTGNPINYGGIIVDPESYRPVAYQIFKRLPKLNAYVFQKEVLANRFIHYYDPFRFEQQHGVTAFKNSIRHGYDIDQIVNFTKLNIKWRASQLPYVTNEQGKPTGDQYYTTTPVNQSTGTARPLNYEVDGVVQNYLKLDEGIMNYPNDFPNQQFQPVISELKRDCAIGAKLPLEFVYRSEAGGVVQRFYVTKAEETFNEEKRWLKATLLNPYKNRSLKWGLATGRLNLSKYGKLADSIELFSGRWQMGRAVSVDYGKEVDADIKQIEAGLMSPQEYMMERGENPIAVMQQITDNAIAVIKAAQKVAAETGMDVNQVLPYIVKKFPNPVQVTEPPADNQDDSTDTTDTTDTKKAA